MSLVDEAACRGRRGGPGRRCSSSPTTAPCAGPCATAGRGPPGPRGCIGRLDQPKLSSPSVGNKRPPSTSRSASKASSAGTLADGRGRIGRAVARGRPRRLEARSRRHRRSEATRAADGRPRVGCPREHDRSARPALDHDPGLHVHLRDARLGRDHRPAARSSSSSASSARSLTFVILGTLIYQVRKPRAKVEIVEGPRLAADRRGRRARSSSRVSPTAGATP